MVEKMVPATIEIGKDIEKIVYGAFAEPEEEKKIRKLLFPNTKDVILDPIHGRILIPKHIRTIIDSCEFQRLRHIKQLGEVDLIYPGATHNRFSHSLGVYHLARLVLINIYNSGQFIPSRVIRIFLYSSLLHDIGHPPFSHALEDVKIMERGEIRSINHEEKASEIIWREGRSQLLEQINVANIFDEDEFRVIALIIDNDEHGNLPELLDLCKECSYSNIEIRYLKQLKCILHEIIDRVDYLLRDSHYCGVEYGKIDHERFINSLRLDENKDKTDSFYFMSDKGLQPMFSFLLGREQMFRVVYHHKDVRAVHNMLRMAVDDFLKEIPKGKSTLEALDEIAHMNDISLLVTLSSIQTMKELFEKSDAELDILKSFCGEWLRDQVNAKRKFLTNLILNRKIYKRIFTFKPNDFISARKKASAIEQPADIGELIKDGRTKLLKLCDSDGQAKPNFTKFINSWAEEIFKEFDIERKIVGNIRDLNPRVTDGQIAKCIDAMKEILVICDFSNIKPPMRELVPNLRLIKDWTDPGDEVLLDLKFQKLNFERGLENVFVINSNILRIFVMDLLISLEENEGAYVRKLRLAWNNVLDRNDSMKKIIPRARGV